MTREEKLLEQLKKITNERLQFLKERNNFKMQLEGQERKIQFMKDLINEKFEKYAWHNLIEEPEKLPEYEKVVEIWIKGMDFPNSACRESIGGGEWRWWVYWGSGYEIGNKSAVVAWREIEKPNF